jgi:4-amino-4-deoxy-L-arabinose transferase-like glycosyltransferase
MHPDEPFQSLEQAHRVVYGYGIVPWEFLFGARFWFFPALYVPLLWLLRTLGLDDPARGVVIIRSFNALCSLALVWGAYLLGRELKDDATGLIASLLCALWYLFVYYSVRTLADTFVMNVIPFPFLLIGRSRGGSLTGRFFGGLLMGAAFFIRFQVAVFLLPLSAFLCVRRDMRGLLAAAGGFSVCLILQGAIDYLRWGSVVHSMGTYLAFHFTGLPAMLWGKEPWYFYLARFWNEFYPISPLMVLLFIYGLYELPLIGGSALVFIVFLSILLHKEARFEAPALPLLFVSIAAGLTGFSARVRGQRLRRLVAALAVSAILLVSCARSLHFSWQQNSAHASALAYLSRRSDVRAVTVVGAYWWETGGYFYLHHNVPLEAFGTPGEYQRYAPPRRTPDMLLENAIRNARTSEALMGQAGYHYHLSLKRGEEPNCLVIARRLLTRGVRLHLRKDGFRRIHLMGECAIYARQ